MKPKSFRVLSLRVVLLMAGAAHLMFAAGCSTTTPASADSSSLPPKVAAMAEADDLFPWAGDTLEAEGSAPAPRTIVTEPQRSLAGKMRAKRSAIAALKKRIESLPVTETQNLEAVMEANIGVRRSVERYLDTAVVVSERETSEDHFEVRVRASLRPLAEILEQNFITPNEAPEATPVSAANNT